MTTTDRTTHDAVHHGHRRRGHRPDGATVADTVATPSPAPPARSAPGSPRSPRRPATPSPRPTAMVQRAPTRPSSSSAPRRSASPPGCSSAAPTASSSSSRWCPPPSSARPSSSAATGRRAAPAPGHDPDRSLLTDVATASQQGCNGRRPSTGGPQARRSYGPSTSSRPRANGGTAPWTTSRRTIGSRGEGQGDLAQGGRRRGPGRQGREPRRRHPRGSRQRRRRPRPARSTRQTDRHARADPIQHTTKPPAPPGASSCRAALQGLSGPARLSALALALAEQRDDRPLLGRVGAGRRLVLLLGRLDEGAPQRRRRGRPRGPPGGRSCRGRRPACCPAGRPSVASPRPRRVERRARRPPARGPAAPGRPAPCRPRSGSPWP